MFSSCVYGVNYNASEPDSPVRMRMACSMVEMKILPSPMRPVRAAVWMASTALVDEFIGNDDLDFHLGQEIDHIFGAAIKLRVALLAPKALGLGHRNAQKADFLQRLLHLIKLERLDDRFDFFHGCLSLFLMSLNDCTTCAISQVQ